MASQIHTKFTTEQVKELLTKYLNKEVQRKHIQDVLGIGRSRFFEIIQTYRSNPEEFSVDYKRSSPTRSIDQTIKDTIVKELTIDKKAIQNKEIPLYKYNYSYVQKRLEKKHGQSVALSTIINHAKANNLYLPKRKAPKTHDREVLTTHAGEMTPLTTFGHPIRGSNGPLLPLWMTIADSCFMLSWLNVNQPLPIFKP